MRSTRILAALTLALGLSACAVVESPPVAKGPFLDRFYEGYEAYKKNNYAAAYAIWRPLADAGHAKSQFALARMIMDRSREFKTDVSDQQIVDWVTSAADHGLPEAQNELGTIYGHATRAKRNDDLAILWHLRAANGGVAESMRIVISLYSTNRYGRYDPAEAFKWLKLYEDNAPWECDNSFKSIGLEKPESRLAAKERAKLSKDDEEEAERRIRAWLKDRRLLGPSP